MSATYVALGQPRISTMWNYQANTYGDLMAPVYDAYHADLDSTDAVERLTELAGAGPVLELGVGTGRIAMSAGDSSSRS